jgi:hypothetical protein
MLHIHRPRRVCHARRPLFGSPRLPRLWRTVVGDPLRRPGGGGREKEELQLWGILAGKNGYIQRILEGNEINGGELPFLWPTPRARSMFRTFLFRPESPSAPQKAEDGLGSLDG